MKQIQNAKTSGTRLGALAIGLVLALTSLSITAFAVTIRRPAGPTTTRTTTSQASIQAGQDAIGETKAKSIALEHAGFSIDQVTFARAYLDWDDGRLEYEVEFYTGNYQEYDYEIDAYTGEILSFDYDAEYYSQSSAIVSPALPVQPAPARPAAGSDAYISAASAKEIALSRAGLTASSIYSYQCELDRDDGTAMYEIDFKSGGYEYEVDVSASTGKILKYAREWD